MDHLTPIIYTFFTFISMGMGISNICESNCVCDNKEVNKATTAHCFYQTNEIYQYGRLSSQKNLQKLFISELNSTTLPITIFHYLRDLQVLSLRLGPMSTFPYIEEYLLQNLKELHIKETNLFSVDSQYFTSFGNLEVLDLSFNRLNVLPHPFHAPPNLKKLDLSQNEITTLSPYIFDGFINLEELDLSWNILKRLPSKCLSGLDKVSHLSLSGNHINSIETDVLADMSELVSLDLSYNFIEEIIVPSRYPVIFEHLETIDLSNNNLKTIEDIFEIMLKLTELNLNYNKIEKFPEAISDNALKILRIAGNSLNNIRTILKKMPKLHELYADRNNIEKLNHSLVHKELKKLSLSRNKLVSFQCDELSLPSLDELDLSNNFLIAIQPNQFGNLTNLSRLSLSGNNLVVLDSNMFTARNSLLKILDVSYNFIRKIYFNKTRLISLEVLDLSGNEVNKLVENSFEGNITTLNISYNRLRYVNGDAFKKLRSLHELNLSNNNITAISVNLPTTIRNIRVLNLKNNQIRDFTFLRKLSAIHQQNKEEYTIRVQISGNDFVCDCEIFKTLKEFKYTSQNLELRNEILATPCIIRGDWVDTISNLSYCQNG